MKGVKILELTPRKQAVLKAIVKAYIETGEPVGSKILTELIENAPSSATLRNEMSELCELGLLEQPHTSAGRIPTSMGFQFYLKKLMPMGEINEADKAFIDNTLENISEIPEKIPAAVGKILSDMTGYPVITCLMTNSEATVKRVELLRVSRSSLMLLVITNDGRTRNKIVRISADLTPEILKRFNDIIDKKIKRRPISELTLGYMQSVIANAGIDAFSLMPLLTAVFETVNEIDSVSLDLSGMPRLYDISSNEEAAHRIISLIERRDPIISMFERVGSGVIFGSESGYNELSNDTLIAASFNSSDKYRGYIAVLGPKRISFEQIIPSIEYIAKKINNLISEAEKDMED